MKKGNKKELFLLITTLKELGIKYSENLYFKYSSSLIRHLSTLLVDHFISKEGLKKNLYVRKFKGNRTPKFLWYLYL